MSDPFGYGQPQLATVGRASELEAIDLFVEAAATESRLLLITGAVGMGKTTLLEAGRARAEARGIQVCDARPSELETRLDYSGLADLLARVPETVLARLPEPQRRALQVVLLLEEPGPAPPDPRSVATAALGVLRVLATDRSVVLVVDDLPWLDAASARVVAFALRRLSAEPVSLLATVRTTDGREPDSAVTTAIGSDRVQRIAVPAMSLADVRQLLVDRTSFSAGRTAFGRLYRASGGNPYFALELARVAGAGLGSDHSDEVQLPPTLEQVVDDHLAQLSPAVRDVLLVCALAGDPDAEVVLGAAPDPAVAEAGLRDATEAGIIELRERRLNFVHPLLRSAVPSSLPTAARREAHRRLAAVASTRAERARHLALAADGPDEAVAAQLEQAADESHGQGAFETAAELAELAIALTPFGRDESVRRRSIAAAHYHFLASDLSRARTLIEGVLPGMRPGPARAAVLDALALYQRYSGEPAERWSAALDQALSEVGDDDALAASLHFSRGFVAANVGDMPLSLVHVQSSLQRAEASGDPALMAQSCSGVAWARFVTGRGLDLDLVERALAPVTSNLFIPVEMQPIYNAGLTLVYGGALPRAREVFQAGYLDAVERGDEASLPLLVWPLVRTLTLMGHWDEAERLADEGFRAAVLCDSPPGVSLITSARATLRAAKGDVAGTRDDVRRAVEAAATIGLSSLAMMALDAHAALELSLGHADRTHQLLGPVVESLIATGLPEPGWFPSVPDEIEALIRLELLDEASALLEPFVERADVVQREWARATGRRCLGLLQAASGDLEAAEASLEEALDIHRAVGIPLELGRTLLVAAEVHRRARHRARARERLLGASTIFEDLGARVWAGRVTAELTRLGARVSDRPELDLLTEAERRVAELVGQGGTNREVATELFMGVRTVESHLQRVYQKLGIHSRAELAALVGP
jgi:DNA-binding CsgD family transcriptional regulator